MNFPTILPRFLRYAGINTQSDEQSTSIPSSRGQITLLALLAEELKAMDITNAAMDDNGCVMASIPARNSAAPPLGFIAHVDTSPDMSGDGVAPQVIENYDGSDIVLSKEKNIILSPSDFPELRLYAGQTIITTRGETLLGADDKAGIAEIMCLAEHLMQHKELPHGDICIAFTPDEEIGRGVDHFDVSKFGAKYAYTIDGGQIGELEYENFNAAVANITIQGKNIHPGYAKDKMVNALQIAAELNSLLPAAQRPEHTSGYEGFFHLTRLAGSVENAQMQYIIRDHSRERFEQRKHQLEQCARFINQGCNYHAITLDIADQYYNMREQVQPHYFIIDNAVAAMELAAVKPIIRPIRGGTDGARLSFMGLPCPNIFAGGHNFHSKYEFIPLQSMEKAVEVMLNIVKVFAEKHKI